LPLAAAAAEQRALHRHPAAASPTIDCACE